MLRWRIKFVLLLLCVINYISCGLIDLRPIGFEIVPGKSNSLLDNPDSPLIIKFDTEMLKEEAEGIMQVSSDIGIINGDYSWEGNDLYFTPVPCWTAGIRYTLSLYGSIRSADGRELRIEKFISFYAINRNDQPLLIRHSPFDGEPVGTRDLVFEYHFSCSMDRQSVESALNIEGTGNKTYEWLYDDTVLKISHDKTLAPWTSYKWNLKDSAKSIDGVPIVKSYSGYYTTNLDKTLPEVKDIYPVLYADGIWYPTGSCLETGLGPNQGIAVEFNKPMGENVLRSISFEPALTGRIEMLSENSIVYVFNRDPDPETVYTMKISADTRDTEGLKIGDEYRINFIPDIPYLSILSLSFNVKEIPDSKILSYNGSLPVLIDQVTGNLDFVIHFSLSFTTEEKINIVSRITLLPFFPRTLSPVALQNVKWISDDMLYMRWENLSAGKNDENNYYKLTIPGGKTGITNGGGMYLKEDFTVLLETFYD